MSNDDRTHDDRTHDDRTNDDRDLHEYFRAVRREEEAHVPPISVLSPTVRQHGRRRLSGKLAAAAMCLATLIAAVVWLLHGPRVLHQDSNRGQQQAAASITSWKPATDFLLDTPGRELLQGAPDIGEWHGGLNAPGPGERHRPFKKQILP
jgi:hypothetical protein